MAIFTILLSKNKTNYLVDIKGVYFGKLKKKTPEFRKFNVLFNLLSMFSIQVLSRRAKKGK